MSNLENLTIVELIAENVKRLTAVKIRPDGALVEITGRNGAGKTSVLDAIWWALEGAKHIQASPIRKGAKKALIRLDLGTVIVTRTFRRPDGEDDEVTTTLIVENAEGARFPKPQAILDQLFGALTFDPMAFLREDPKKQLAILRGFVTGVDFDAIDAANKADAAKRAEINRDAKAARARAAAIQVPAGKAERVNEDALIQELERAGDHNAAIARAEAERDRLVTRMDARGRERDDMLERDGMKLLAGMAEERGYQVWIERVNSSGKVGFVTEDGALKAHHAAEEVA